MNRMLIGERTVLGAAVVDRHDIGMVEPSNSLGLSLEARDEGRIGAQLGPQQLQRDASGQPRMPREVDDAHAASTEFALDDETGEDLAREERHMRHSASRRRTRGRVCRRCPASVAAMTQTLEPQQQVLTRVEGRLGHLTLNRPERINALSLSMIQLASAALSAWAEDDGVDVVLIDGAGPRGLCAGGDIREVYEGIRGGNVPPARFWTEEYEMNAVIAHYSKPVVTFMDGIVLGGGVGISAHAGVRVVTERSQVAMPETAIGLSPDVGALYLLARAPGGLGTHCALTGMRLDGPAAVHAGLADHLVLAAELPELAEQLRSGVVPELPVPPDAPHSEWIDWCYAPETVEQILARLRNCPDPAAHSAADTVSAMSPTAVTVTLEAIRRAAGMTVDEVLDQDLRVGSRFLTHPDFAEGIRAMIIDKDRQPRWFPADLAEVSRPEVLAFFEPLD